MIVKGRKSQSLHSLWRQLVLAGYEPGSFRTFLRWVSRVESEAEERGYMRVRKGKRKRYIVIEPDGLIGLLLENGYAF